MLERFGVNVLGQRVTPLITQSQGRWIITLLAEPEKCALIGRGVRGDRRALARRSLMG